MFIVNRCQPFLCNVSVLSIGKFIGQACLLSLTNVGLNV